ncbi:Protein disulfide-isomerase 2-3 [Dimargaris xerosporica]|nr:Protein disulfide-isomerase 2-3 [Dimargaris xerosporica]
MVRLTDPQSTFQDCLQPTNDGLIFALSWGKPRSSSHNQPPKRFMSHGLWPGNFSIFNCHTMQTQLQEKDVFQTPADLKLRTSLNSRWLTVTMATNYQLWNHEFTKHGTCVSHINYQRCAPTHWSLLDRQRIETLSYFNMVNIFSQQVNVTALFMASGIAPVYTRPYSRTRILPALATRTQVAVELQCWINTITNSHGAVTQTSTLKEIRFYYQYDPTASTATHAAYTGVAAPHPGNCGPQIYFTP